MDNFHIQPICARPPRKTINCETKANFTMNIYLGLVHYDQLQTKEARISILHFSMTNIHYAGYVSLAMKNPCSSDWNLSLQELLSIMVTPCHNLTVRFTNESQTKQNPGRIILTSRSISILTSGTLVM